MRLTVVGASGSFPGPDSPASCYLLQAPDAAGRLWSVVIELGSGAFGPLQSFIDPALIDAVFLTHLHADHCADLAALNVYTRFHPHGTLPPTPVYLPESGPLVLPRILGSADAGSVELHMDLHVWADGEPAWVGPFLVTPFAVEHPVPAYGLRIVGPSISPGQSAVIGFTGDSDECDGVDDVAAGTDLLMAEATFVEGRDELRGMHLTGARAGIVATRAGARRLLLTHIQPWTDPDIPLREAGETYTGVIDVARTGLVIEV